MMRKKAILFLCLLLVCIGQIVFASGSGPKIRVGLVVNQFSAEVESKGKIKLIDSSGKNYVLPSGRHFISVKKGNLYADSKKLKGNRVSIVASDSKKPVTVNRRKYRGALTAVLNDNRKNLTVINSLSLDHYLYGVVAKEVMPLWPDEAIKAQAVAARSFAMYHMAHPQDKYYDIKANDMGQVYGGIEAEHANTSKFVDATRGIIATYDGEPIQAFFHSSSGGYTESASEVWGKDIPYLRAVQDYDQDAPNYSWTKTMTKVQLERLLSQAGYQVGSLQGIRVSALKKPPMKWSPDRGTSGRVKKIVFRGSKGSVTLTGNKLRNLLGLNSTLFDVYIGVEEPDEIDVPITNSYGYQVGDKKIEISKNKKKRKNAVGDLHLFSDVKGEKVFFLGGGWGHGVGLSQWGARGMAVSKNARRKKDYYKTILKHYYKGIDIDKVY
jgi:stage II sporulation protein D